MTTTTIDLSTTVPPSPERTLQLAETAAELVRVLCHDTYHHEALRSPADADSVIRSLETLAARLPQLAGQLAAWLRQAQESGRIEVPGGVYAGKPARAVATAGLRLDEADAYARNLQVVLGMAAAVTSTMTGTGEHR